MQEIAEDPSVPWETVVLAEGAKGPIVAERKFIRCFACRKDGNRNYVKPGPEIWLYLRKYADGEIKYFVSNAPGELPAHELDRAATLRWPIEQCFEECKSSLGMGHYECRSYRGWKRHMLFVMIAHLFTTSMREIFKKSNSPDRADGGKTDAWDFIIYRYKHESYCMLPYTQESSGVSLP